MISPEFQPNDIRISEKKMKPEFRHLHENEKKKKKKKMDKLLLNSNQLMQRL